MGSTDIAKRVQTERAAYNAGIERKTYDAGFGHAQSGYAQDRREIKIAEIMKNARRKVVLEIGSISWAGMIDFKGATPKSLTCINISERELEQGVQLAKKRSTSKYCQHNFILMDAHKLKFPNDTFDIVYGAGILHHLDFETALKEVHRVLKPGGEMLFFEPLGRNPVGKLIRKLTPNARTPDEKPLDKPEFEIIEKYFETDNSYYQLFSVPAGVVSGHLFKSPYNRLMQAADKFDIWLENISKKTSLGLYFRNVLIHGWPRHKDE